jgi:sugar fermentation stimulation protein A
VIAHVGNTGSLKGICDEPRPCRVAYHSDPNRKLKYSLEQVKTPTSWVGVNTHVANTLVAEAFNSRLWPNWEHLVEMKREFKLSDETRLDFRFTDRKGRFHYVEVKSATMCSPDSGRTAQFPDAETTRGHKHLRELMELQRRRQSTEIVFVVQRTDAKQFAPADHVDPVYAELLWEGKKRGVQVSAYPVDLTANEAEISANALPLNF